MVADLKGSTRFDWITRAFDLAGGAVVRGVAPCLVETGGPEPFVSAHFLRRKSEGKRVEHEQ